MLSCSGGGANRLGDGHHVLCLGSDRKLLDNASDNANLANPGFLKDSNKGDFVDLLFLDDSDRNIRK